MRVPGQIEEFKATALLITLRSMSWGMRALRAGWSKASTAPARKDMVNRCHTSTRSMRVMAANRKMRLAVMV